MDFKEVFNHLGEVEEFTKMQYQCFGNYCFIMDNDDHSVYFDILTQKIYMAEYYIYCDNSDDISTIKVWVDPDYLEAFIAEAQSHDGYPEYHFVKTLEELFVGN